MLSPLAWQKSTYSAGTTGNECVELARTDGVVLLRESDEPDMAITTTRHRLVAFIHALKEGRLHR
ncbi:DUF397 domain-containing protein [Streptomyces sp. ISL-11]|uniref:DUF397 domain-containing protein n=1 Tax=Streptomyces sp. ISL-11 TaxID=2819174 RepID=UPI001BEC9437|nr:DUF397 domain-containing protein [Streptomyces sp. ISL-11]MBT2384086.1 DUF397 domain-containing protein [Streptomyces sp. ISL-11]